MKTVDIKTGKPYSVHIGPGLIDMCGDMIAAVMGGRKCVVVTDDVVAPLYLDRCLASLRKSGIECEEFIFPHGERSKELSTVSDMLECFAKARLTRADFVVALGGGVTGDMAGFAAGIYQRGIKYAQLPTTLLASVDSSVGGKTAVNLAAGKNLAGVFIQPSVVVCDTDTLATLTPEIFADGAAESIKYGVLCDEELFNVFETGDVSASISDIIVKCVRYKGALVERDEFDHGDRRYLNLGHTIGHAIEKSSGYTIPHGHAVAIGMVMIARAGEKMGLTEAGTTDRLTRVLSRNNLPTSTGFTAGELLPAALSDKKRMGGTVTVVMAEKIGKCFLKDVDVTELGKIIELGKE